MHWECPPVQKGPLLRSLQGANSNTKLRRHLRHRRRDVVTLLKNRNWLPIVNTRPVTYIWHLIESHFTLKQLQILFVDLNRDIINLLYLLLHILNFVHNFHSLHEKVLHGIFNSPPPHHQELCLQYGATSTLGPPVLKELRSSGRISSFEHIFMYAIGQMFVTNLDKCLSIVWWIPYQVDPNIWAGLQAIVEKQCQYIPQK
jgi:hypothetical protein